jgi:hypothetical protein
MRLPALFAIAVLPYAADAQMTEVLPGARVRLSLSGGRLDGAVVSRTADSLVIAPLSNPPGAPNRRIALGLESIESVDVFHGRSRSRAAVRAVLWTGAVLTLASLAPPDTAQCHSQCLSRLQTFVITNVFLDPLAAAIGGAIGMDKWSRQRPTQTAYTVAPQPAGSLGTDNSAVPMPGTRIRLTAPGVLADQLDATIVRRPSDSLVVATQAGLEYSVALASVTSIDRFDGRSAKEGAKRGFIVGAITMLPFAILFPALAGCDGACIVGAAAYFDAGYGGLGAAIGAGIGVDKWTRVDLRPRVSALPNGRFGIGFNMR